MHALHLRDFRARRYILDDDDFALVEHDPKIPALPEIRIRKWVWQHLTSLPDDVAIRTTDHYGNYLRRMTFASWRLMNIWSEINDRGLDINNSPLCYAISTLSEEIDASIYNALTGYYRASFACLRNVLENITVGVWLELNGTPQQFQAWQQSEEFTFNAACQGLYSNTLFVATRTLTIQAVNDDIFRQQNSLQSAGFARRLYKFLSSYTHGRPGFSHVDLWRSNGPVFQPPVFGKWLNASGQTLCLCAFLIASASPNSLNRDHTILSNILKLFGRMLYLVPGNADGEALLCELQTILSKQLGASLRQKNI